MATTVYLPKGFFPIDTGEIQPGTTTVYLTKGFPPADLQPQGNGLLLSITRNKLIYGG